MDYLPLWLAAMLGVIALAAGPSLLRNPVFVEITAPLMRPTLAQPDEPAVPPPVVAQPTEVPSQAEPAGAAPMLALVRGPESLPANVSQPETPEEATGQAPAAGPTSPTTTTPESGASRGAGVGAQSPEPEKAAADPPPALPGYPVRPSEAAPVGAVDPTTIGKPPGEDRPGPGSRPDPGTTKGAAKDKGKSPDKGSDDRPGKPNDGPSSGKDKPEKDAKPGKDKKPGAHDKAGKKK